MDYFIYKHSIPGSSHISKHPEAENPQDLCQDNSYVRADLPGGWVIAAVADGVGSACNSKTGSEIASRVAVEYCANLLFIDNSKEGYIETIKAAFKTALAEIRNASLKSGQPLSSYDTTLSLVVYNGAKICYGHSGDGGIIGLTEYGNYVSITKPQNDPADGISVIPLRAGPSAWEFGSFEEELVSVLLVTDGVLAALKPYKLKEHDPEFHVPTLSFLMHPAWYAESKGHYQDMTEEFLKGKLDQKLFYAFLGTIYLSAIDDTPDNIRAALSEIANYGFAFSLINEITDDKTALAIINPNKPIQDKKPLAYYAEADWNALNEAWNRKAYPHLYAPKAPPAPVPPVSPAPPVATQQNSQPSQQGPPAAVNSGQPLQLNYPPPQNYPGFPPPRGAPSKNKKSFMKGSKKGKTKIFLLLVGSVLLLLFVIVAAASKGNGTEKQTSSSPSLTAEPSTSPAIIADVPDIPTDNNGNDINAVNSFGEPVVTTYGASTQSDGSDAEEEQLTTATTTQQNID